MRVFIALVFITINLFAGTQKVPSAIGEARQKIIERDRNSAVAILLAAAQKEKSGPRQSEIIKELGRLTTLFLSNEGQRAFELAESMRFSAQPGFLSKYDEALKLEPGNLQILIGQAIGLIALKNCKKSLALLQEIEKSDPYRYDVKYLKFRAQQCAEAPAVQKIQEDELETLKDLGIYRKIAKAERALFLGRVATVVTLGREVIASDPNFPMGYYWLWRGLVKDGDGGVEEAQKYLSLCKGLNASLRRRYSLEPTLCADQEEVEDYLKKIESQKP